MQLSHITFEPVTLSDGEALADLRVLAMRESLEAVGRFDEARAKSRFLDSFCVEATHQICVDGHRVGFVVVRKAEDHIALDNLYVLPAFQNQGIGAVAMKRVIALSATTQLPIRLGALKQSRANDFYLKYGFVKVRIEEWDNYYQREAHN